MTELEQKRAKYTPAEELPPMLFGEHIQFRRYQAKSVALARIDMARRARHPNQTQQNRMSSRPCVLPLSITRASRRTQQQ